MTAPTTPQRPRNVLGEPLAPCCHENASGFYRDGFCRVGPEDIGLHAICAEVTEQFLVFSRARGNDLVTPRPDVGFPGLTPGDRWCLCAGRWQEALAVGLAPPVLLASTDQRALDVVTIEDLRRHALDG